MKHFDRIILDGLGIDAHPELRDLYFGNYTKMIYLAADDPDLDTRARSCADDSALRSNGLPPPTVTSNRRS